MRLVRVLSDDVTIQRWIGFVYDFFSCYDREKDIYIHLPSGNGYYEQDEFFFTIWQAIRNEYNKLMMDKIFLEKLERRRAELNK